MNIKKKILFESIYILLIGIISSFSLPPYNYWIINFFTFSLLLIFLFKRIDKNIKFFFLYGYLFGFGYFLSSLYWIPFSLKFDENFKSLIFFAIIIIPAFLSFYYSLAFGIFKFFSNPNNLFVNILTFSLILSLFEYLRGNILSGFPWNLFVYSLSNNISFIQINSLIGIYAFNMIMISIFSIPSVFYFKRKKNEFIGFILIFVTFISFYIYGKVKINDFNNLENIKLSKKIKILSTTIPIERFYSNLDSEKTLIKLIDLSNPKTKEITVFIWPEGIIPNVNLESFKKEFDYLLKKSFTKDHTIILGINDDKKLNGNQKYYNSLSIIDNEANILYKYYKNNLVPFGEFLPLENVLSQLGLKNLTNNYQSYTKSNERKLYSFKNDTKIKILPLICYEIIYSGKLSSETDFNFIVNISEDGWFGKSIGPYQHFAHAIFRSIEYGKYTLRSANNGISAIINPTGVILDKIDIDNEGVISINEIKKVEKTLFSKFGNKIYFLIILLYIFLIFSFKKIKNE